MCVHSTRGGAFDRFGWVPCARAEDFWRFDEMSTSDAETLHDSLANSQCGCICGYGNSLTIASSGSQGTYRDVDASDCPAHYSVTNQSSGADGPVSNCTHGTCVPPPWLMHSCALVWDAREKRIMGVSVCVCVFVCVCVCVCVC